MQANGKINYVKTVKTKKQKQKKGRGVTSRKKQEQKRRKNSFLPSGRSSYAAGHQYGVPLTQQADLRYIIRNSNKENFTWRVWKVCLYISAASFLYPCVLIDICSLWC